jgi:hypothetical protein
MLHRDLRILAGDNAFDQQFDSNRVAQALHEVPIHWNWAEPSNLRQVKSVEHRIPRHILGEASQESLRPKRKNEAEGSTLRSMRAAKRKSCHNVSTKDSHPAVRTTSFETSRLPRSKRTARSASLRLIRAFIFSSAAISKKTRSSSSNPPSTRSFRNSDRNPSDRLRSSDMVPYS